MSAAEARGSTIPSMRCIGGARRRRGTAATRRVASTPRPPPGAWLARGESAGSALEHAGAARRHDGRPVLARSVVVPRAASACCPVADIGVRGEHLGFTSIQERQSATPGRPPSRRLEAALAYPITRNITASSRWQRNRRRRRTPPSRHAPGRALVDLGSEIPPRRTVIGLLRDLARDVVAVAPSAGAMVARAPRTPALRAPAASAAGSTSAARWRSRSRQPECRRSRRPGAPRGPPDVRRGLVYLDVAPRQRLRRARARPRRDGPAQRDVRAAPARRADGHRRWTSPTATSPIHNVFSLSRARRFDLGRYAAGKSKSVRFDRPGVVRVFCDIHSHMSAFIVVFAHRFFGVTDVDGRYAADNVPPGTYTRGRLVRGRGRASALGHGDGRRRRRTRSAGALMPGSAIAARTASSWPARCWPRCRLARRVTS